MAHESPAWEFAFAHPILANAAAAAGNRELHAMHYERAQTLGEAMPDAEGRSIFQATFRVVPVPA